MKPYVVILLGVIATQGCTSSNRTEPVPESEQDVQLDDLEVIDANEIVRTALAVVNTKHLKNAIDTIPSPNVGNSFLLIEQDASSVRTFACPVSGTVSVESGPNGAAQYNNCVVESTQFNGKYRQNGASGISLVNFEGFSITQGDEQLFIERGFLFYRESLDVDRTRQWRWTDTVFSNTTVESSLAATITDVYLQRTGNDEYRADIEATVTFENTTFSVSTATPLVSQNGDSYYTTGQLEISEIDVFNILIDADGGNTRSALITITQNGSAESQIWNWSEQFYVDCLSELWPIRPTIDCN